MKNLTFKGAKIKITKDRVVITTGLLLLLLSTVLLGIFSWANVGFNGNFDKDFWFNYAMTMASVLLGFSGILIARLVSERKRPNYITTNLKLKEAREIITKNKKIGEFKFWLKWIYNYQRKVDKMQEVIIMAQEKLKVRDKPQEDIKEFSVEKYNQLKLKYDEYVAKKIELDNYMYVVDVHYKIIDAYKKNELSLVDKYSKDIEAKLADKIDPLNKISRKLSIVTYAKIFNGSYKGSRDEGIDINYKFVLMKKILPKVLMGACITLLFTSLDPAFVGWNFKTLVMMIIKMISLTTYILFAVRTASEIAEMENLVDENRIIIYDSFREDAGIYGTHKWIDVDEIVKDHIDEVEEIKEV